MATKRLTFAIMVIFLAVCGWLLSSGDSVAAGDVNAVPGKADGEILVPSASGPSGGSSGWFLGGTAKGKAATRGSDRLYDSRGRRLHKARELLVRFRPEAAALRIEALHRALGSTVLKEIGRLKLHRVRLREGLSETEGAALYAASMQPRKSSPRSNATPFVIPC